MDQAVLDHIEKIVTFAALHILAALGVFGSIYTYFKARRDRAFMVPLTGEVTSKVEIERTILTEDIMSNVTLAVPFDGRQVIVTAEVMTRGDSPHYAVGTRYPVLLDRRAPETNHVVGSHDVMTETVVLAFIGFYGLCAVGFLWVLQAAGKL